MVWDIACASKILWMPFLYFWYSVNYSYVLAFLFVNYSYVSVFACISVCWSGGSQLFVSCVSSADLNNSTE